MQKRQVDEKPLKIFSYNKLQLDQIKAGERSLKSVCAESDKELFNNWVSKIKATVVAKFQQSRQQKRQ